MLVCRGQLSHPMFCRAIFPVKTSMCLLRGLGSCLHVQTGDAHFPLGMAVVGAAEMGLLSFSAAFILQESQHPLGPVSCLQGCLPSFLLVFSRDLSLSRVLLSGTGWRFLSVSFLLHSTGFLLPVLLSFSPSVNFAATDGFGVNSFVFLSHPACSLTPQQSVSSPL